MKLGEKIKALRKEKNISQEVFANYLGVSFQAVSKWETGNTMPDITLIPAIASFFEVSTDELFNFNLYEVEKNIDAIVTEHTKYWDTDLSKSEQILRNGLKKYPGNDTLLTCLMGILLDMERTDEVITIGKALVESTKYDELRFDCYRILAMAYKKKGEYEAAKDAIEHIPEIYFSKLEVAALLLEGEERYEAAQKHKNLSVDDLIEMLIIIGKYLKEKGEFQKAKSQFIIAQKIIEAFSFDFIETKYFKTGIYESMREKQKELEQLLGE